MLILDSTTRSIEVLLAGAVTTSQLPIYGCFVDIATGAFTAACSQTATNNTTAVTAVAAPAASTQRQTKQLHIYNADTVAATVTVRFNDNGTTRILKKVTLAVGSTLEYTDGQGWRTADSSGNTLTSSSTGAAPFSDASALVKNNSDATKLIILSAASITTATTRTLTAQDASYTLAGTTVALGGTGAATFTANGVMLGNGTSALAVTAAGTNNQVLCGNSGSAPAFRSLTYADMPVTTLAVFTPLDNQPPASAYAVLGNRNNHATLEFDNSANWDAIFEGVLGRAYVGGNVVVSIAWAALSGTSGNVGWQGSFERLNAANHNLDTDAFATAQASSADACNGTNGKLTVSTITFTSSQIDGVVAGDAFRLRIRRDTTVSSNLAARAQLISCELKG